MGPEVTLIRRRPPSPPGGRRHVYAVRELRVSSLPALRSVEAPVETFTIITGEPNSLVADLHNRMPVILDRDDYDAWLKAADTAIPQAMLQSFPARLMTAFPVSKRVNSPKNDDPKVIEPLQLASG